MASADVSASGSMPPMMQSLDIVLPAFDEVHDLRIVSREFPAGRGSYSALHNTHLSNSLMTGSFESRHTGRDGVVQTMRYEGTLLNAPHDQRPTPHGQGVRRNPDKSVYTGQFKDGHPDGMGEWKAASPSCESYVGEWKRGKKHGHGVHKFENGDMYEGDWANGVFHDRGKYIYAFGDEFLGIFQQGVKKNGSFYFKDGRISRRVWERGQLVSCQDFDCRKRTYAPTITHAQVHDVERNTYGARHTQCAALGMVSPRGVRIP